MVKKSSILFNDHEDILLDKASLSLGLSDSNFNEDTGEFFVTIDRALFKSPLEIITTVLEAHGFLQNLENILACLDQLKFGVVATSGGKVSKEGLVAKNYLPAISFKMPQKSITGYSLKKFYQEVEAYELAIKELQDNPEKKTPSKSNKKDLVETNKELEAEVKTLKQEIDSLNNLLQKAVKSEAYANQALASQNILPTQMRLGVVRDIDVGNRVVIVKSSRTTVNLPLTLCELLPNVGDKCLIQIDSGVVTGCYFYETTGERLKPILCEIIMHQNQIVKVRDTSRRTWLVSPQNDIERDSLSRLKKKDFVLLYVVDGQILRFQNIVPGTIPYFDLFKDLFSRYESESEKLEENAVGRT
ncbi:MAG: hypothetical protein HRU19_02230 [Pseudobacteriovorax sp.]|nr:hypothetical protein [Pseudobacteriovorax sp.]